MDFGWKAILDILQPRALPFFFSLPYTAYWSNKDKTVMVLQKGKIVDLIFHHFVQSSILKEGMFWSWRRPGLIKGKGAAIPPAVTSSHLKITTTKNLKFKVSHSLVRQKFLLRWYSSQLYSWRVLRVLDGWRIVAAPWPFQVSSSSSSLTSPLRIERSAIEQRLSWAPPLLDYPPNTCQLSIEQRDNDISAKHCISLRWNLRVSMHHKMHLPLKVHLYDGRRPGGSIVFMKDLSNMFKLVGWFSVYNIIKESLGKSSL